MVVQMIDSLFILLATSYLHNVVPTTFFCDPMNMSRIFLQYMWIS